MKTIKNKVLAVASSDPDIQGSFAALKRAAKRAKQLAEATGTPLYVIKNGKIVNLNPRAASI
jgi:hypothetical protein